MCTYPAPISAKLEFVMVFLETLVSVIAADEAFVIWCVHLRIG